MSITKQALIRYHALDRCFGNPRRRYFIEDLVQACNSALFESYGIEDGVKRRQVLDDIKFMESEQGYSIPLLRKKDGKRVYYRYDDDRFSIRNRAINEAEVEQLREALSVLTRFQGLPQFAWVEEMLVRLESEFSLTQSKKPVVAFEQNPYLKGLHFFTDIFHAIEYQTVLEISYQGYRQAEPSIVVLHPYYLKQYNSRWFLFGHNAQLEVLSNLALDRILAIKALNTEYRENKDINFEEYFDDVVGVSVPSNEEPKQITIEVEKSLWPYIESKPIHGSQRVISKTDEIVTIALTVYLNYELVVSLLAYGERIKVLKPDELRQTIKTTVENMLTSYL